MTLRHLWAAALAAALAVATFAPAGCSTISMGDALVIAVESAPRSLDPRLGSIDSVSARIHQIVFDSLVRKDEHFDFVPHLPALKLPVLVVCGADDQGTPAAENRRLAELVPGGRYVEIADARHLPNVEQAERFNRIMMDWLAAQR